MKLRQVINEVTQKEITAGKRAWERRWTGFKYKDKDKKIRDVENEALGLGGSRFDARGRGGQFNKYRTDLADYLYHDRGKMRGRRGKGGKEMWGSLEQAVQQSEGVTRPFVTYRGLRLPEKTVNRILVRVDKKGNAKLANRNKPASFTESKEVAWDFAKETGHRGNIQGIPIILELLAQPGTKVLWLDLAQMGTGNEHVFSKESPINIKRYRSFRDGYVLTGTIG